MSLFRRSTSSKASEKLTRLFFASDFHGSQRIFRKFLNAAKHYAADVLVMGGDVVGKLAIPVIREGKDRYRAHPMANPEHPEGEDGLKDSENRLNPPGYTSRFRNEMNSRPTESDTAAVVRL